MIRNRILQFVRNAIHDVFSSRGKVLIGRYSSSPGVVQEITLGAGIALSDAGVLSSSGSAPVTASVSAANSAARLALSSASAIGFAVIEADTGRVYMLISGGNPALSGDWLQIGDRDIQLSDVSGLSSALSSEALTRATADNGLSAALNAETSARTAADTSLAADLATETSIRDAQNQFELFFRQAADTSLTASIASEASQRIAADNGKAPIPLYVTSPPVNGVTAAENGQLVRVSKTLNVEPFTDYICRRSGGVATTVFNKIGANEPLFLNAPPVDGFTLGYSGQKAYVGSGIEPFVSYENITIPGQPSEWVKSSIHLASISSLQVSVATNLGVLSLGKTIFCSGTAADYSVTLPAVNVSQGRFVDVVMAAELTRFVSIASTALIDGQASRIMWSGESARFYSNGFTWMKIQGTSKSLRARLSASAAYPIPSNSVLQHPLLNLGAGDDPSGRMADAPGSRIQIRRSGHYRVRGTIRFSAFTQQASIVIAYVYRNGVEVAIHDTLALVGSLPAPAAQGIVYFDAGDFATLWLYHNAASNQNTFVAASRIADLYVEEVSPY